tara:strand:+ start:8457 stop:9221 length:765 start_codon:yes stop_codon:yes gene_type:complete
MESFKDFIEIEDYINDTLKIISEIEGKCSNLHDIYKQYLKQIIESKDYLTSLDTLYFQITLTQKELENFVQLFDIFIYQMYGQYYKFYIKVSQTIKTINKEEIFRDINIDKKFFPYNDLLLEKYSIEDIKSIHNFILSVIICINNYIEKQKYEIEDDYIRVKKGVNIDSLVFEKKKFVDFLYNENELFIKTKTKFYDYQKKILKRLILKLKLLYLQIDQDIQFESFNYKTNLYDNVQCYFKTGIIKILHLFCLR